MTMPGRPFHSLLILSIAWCMPAMAAAACSSGDALQEQVRKQLASVQANQGLQLQLKALGPLPELETPTVRLVTQGLRSRVAVEVSGAACGQGGQVRQTLWFAVRALREAWVYGRNTKAEHRLDEAAPRRELIDVASLQVGAEELPGSLEGMWLTQAVNAGMPVLRRHLQAEPLVHRSAPVTVVVYGPGLMLRTQGKAMRAGALGEQVPVMLDGADSSLLAVVAGKGEVHVER